jgi:hypothetical protein
MALGDIRAMIWMLVVETIAKARRARRVHGTSIREICGDLAVSRKLVRKALRSDATKLRYVGKEQPLLRIGPWQADRDGLLEAIWRTPCSVRPHRVLWPWRNGLSRPS